MKSKLDRLVLRQRPAARQTNTWPGGHLAVEPLPARAAGVLRAVCWLCRQDVPLLKTCPLSSSCLTPTCKNGVGRGCGVCWDSTCAMAAPCGVSRLRGGAEHRSVFPGSPTAASRESPRELLWCLRICSDSCLPLAEARRNSQKKSRWSLSE